MRIYNKNNNKPQNGRSAFTLVELIVVITILAILGVIGFISLNSYNTYARDSLRLSNIRTAISGLEIQYTQGGYYSVPDNAVEIGSGSSIVLKQGTIGSKVERAIKASKGIGLDPVTQQEYTYATNEGLTRFQILAFFEGDTTFSPHLASPKGRGVIGESSYAEDITKIRTFGKEVGALTTEGGTPIEKVMSGTLDLGSDSTSYIAHFDDTNNKTLTGSQLYNGLYFVNKTAPKKCPTGYIKVPGNIEFMTNDFCVAKYEMSYKTPNDLTTGTDWNTDDYNPLKTDIVSQRGGYPITEITQSGAIESCKSIGGHLITNNEWMTIARNVEQNGVNWSSGNVGDGFIYNGISENTTMGCDGNIDGNWAEKTGSDCELKRLDGKSRNVLTLNNGEEIYDLSGNVWEHVNKKNTIDGSDFNNGLTFFDEESGNWNGTYQWHKTGWSATSITDEIRSKYGPSFSTYGISNGMGNIHGKYNTSSNNIFIRGASAHGGSDAGVFALVLSWASDNSSWGVGFRCVK